MFCLQKYPLEQFFEESFVMRRLKAGQIMDKNKP